MQNQTKTEMIASKTTPPAIPAAIDTFDLVVTIGVEDCVAISVEAVIGPLVVIAGTIVQEAEDNTDEEKLEAVIDVVDVA